jgi:hypothetical protein
MDEHRRALYAAAMPRIRSWLAGATAAACLLPGAAAGASLSGAAAVAALNTQRAANGIPGDLVQRTDWTAACTAHVRYLERNGGIGGPEDPRLPGYSKAGNWAAVNAALARDAWTARHDPWAQMPIQAMALLSPLLTQVGAAGSRHYVCATTRPGYLRPAPARPALYPYPGDGATGVPYAQWSYGSPFTPGDFVGLPAGFTTGPNLLVMSDVGGDAKLTAASLTGPDGPVEIRTVDNDTDQIGGTLAPGAIIIPADQLEPGQTYTASATVAIAGTSLSRTWRFTTAQADPQTQLFVSSAAVVDPSVPGGIRQGSVAARSSSPAPIHFTIAAGGQTIATRDLASGEIWTPPQTPGTYQACAHQDATAGFAAFDRCAPLRIRDLASFVHPTRISIKAALSGRKLRYTLAVRPALRRRVKLVARRLVKGRWQPYRTVVRDARFVLERTVTTRSADQVVQMVVSVPKGSLGAETYLAATVVETVHRTHG